MLRRFSTIPPLIHATVAILNRINASDLGKLPELMVQFQTGMNGQRCNPGLVHAILSFGFGALQGNRKAALSVVPISNLGNGGLLSSTARGRLRGGGGHGHHSLRLCVVVARVLIVHRVFVFV